MAHSRLALTTTAWSLGTASFRQPSAPAGIGFGGHSQGKRRLLLSVNVCCRACKQILMRFCRRTNVAAIAGMARKRGCAAPPLRIVFQIGSGTKGKEAITRSGECRVARGGPPTTDHGT